MRPVNTRHTGDEVAPGRSASLAFGGRGALTDGSRKSGPGHSTETDIRLFTDGPGPSSWYARLRVSKPLHREERSRRDDRPLACPSPGRLGSVGRPAWLRSSFARRALRPLLARGSPAGPSPKIATGLGDLGALAPEALVDSFYRWYVRKSAAALTDGTLASSGYLTAGYTARLMETVAGFERGAVDPLLCAQDMPTRFTARRVGADVERAVVHVTTSFPGHLLEVHLTRADGQWRIDQVYCGAREAPFQPTLVARPTLTLLPSAGGQAQDELTAGWPVYVNDAYGFRFALRPTGSMPSTAPSRAYHPRPTRTSACWCRSCPRNGPNALRSPLGRA